MFESLFIIKLFCMKQILIIAACLVFITASAQPGETRKNKKSAEYRATVKTTDGDKDKGWLYKLEDTSISLLPMSRMKFRSAYLNSTEINQPVHRYPVSNIKTITTRKKNAALTGTLIGLGTGIAAGVVSGLMSDDETRVYDAGLIAITEHISAEEKMLGNSFLMGITGAITGYFIGKFARKKFKIGGKKENYYSQESELMKRLITK
jgi:hypothetical protein